jgi:hypothetical protein
MRPKRPPNSISSTAEALRENHREYSICPRIGRLRGIGQGAEVPDVAEVNGRLGQEDHAKHTLEPSGGQAEDVRELPLENDEDCHEDSTAANRGLSDEAPRHPRGRSG